MVKLEKSIKKIIDNYSVIIIIIIAIGLFYFLNNYNNKKSISFENYKNISGYRGYTNVAGKNNGGMNNSNNNNNKVNIKAPSASKPLGYNEVSMPISGIKTNMGGIKPKDCNIEKMINPSELLPLNNGKYFNNMNPNGNGDLKNVNLITGAEKIGMASQVLRNANLQLRCEPPNPIKKVGPWMQTTIEPDLHRRPLDGTCK